MPNVISKSDLHNVATALAIGARGSWSSLDYSGLSKVGATLDYSDDVTNITVGPSSVNVMSLDNAADTAETTKGRAALRRYVLASMLRNARKAHNSDTLDLRAYFADTDEKGTRGFIVERVK